MIHPFFILFFFCLGACVGSFLNVVVWRLPRGESIVSPPSHCPKCGTKLAWYDNIPIFGWIALKGKCRYCKVPISSRYPIVEAITAGLFVLVYVTMFIYQEGPCLPMARLAGELLIVRDMAINNDWPLYLLYVAMVAALLAASLIDAELYIIPLEIPWLIAALGLVVHGFTDMPYQPGALNAIPQVGALAAGAGVGLVISILLLRWNMLQQSFAEGGPLMEIEKEAVRKSREEAKDRDQRERSDDLDCESPELPEFTPAQIRAEMRKEMVFLMPPLLLGALWLLVTWKIPAMSRMWTTLMSYHWLSGFLGALWGGLIGAFIIWFTRIAGSYAFGREAMGLGDVHLMFGIGAVIGAAGSAIVFFLAPFIGLLFALYKLLFGRGREVPYGPFLSVATLVVMLFYCRFIDYLSPSMTAMVEVLRQKLPG